MATARLSKRTVDAAAPKATRYTLFDEDLTGFGLRVFPSGQKSYVIEYRAGEGGRRAPKKRVTLGSTATLTPDKAREAASKMLARVKLGSDPAFESRKHVGASDLGGSRARISLRACRVEAQAEDASALSRPARAVGYSQARKRQGKGRSTCGCRAPASAIESDPLSSQSGVGCVERALCLCRQARFGARRFQPGARCRDTASKAASAF